MPDADENVVGLKHEFDTFVPVADRIALGDLGIQRRFANTTFILFIVTNLFLLAALGLVFWQESVQLAAGLIGANERIIDARVVIALLGATTVQLGAVIYTMARAIFSLPIRSSSLI